jgi:Zn-dependent peptidase ImmA (M78 family)/DNA-binding XRE family transcriptional regulator
MFSCDRLRLARQRRKLTGKALADAARVSPVTVSKIENGHQPEDYVVDQLAQALRYPRDFFFLDAVELPDAEIVSFRSLKKMSAGERDASLAAGALGTELYKWIDGRFNLPEADLIDLTKERNRPESAARMLRQHWGLGDRPIGNMLKLLEAKGIRILSLSESTLNVDAYSFWHDDVPYIFLNQEKSAERSIFDSAHELGHLVLHYHAGAKNERGAEMQADRFASAFLMPEADILSHAAGIFTASQIIQAKKRWKVSAMALAFRLHSLNIITEWNYRSLCIELGKRGYRSSEPDGVERETSSVLLQVLTTLWAKRLTKADIAHDLRIPLEEIESLIFRLAALPAKPQGGTSTTAG